MNTYAIVVGRVLLGALFLVAGITKATGIDGTAGMIESAGLPMPMILPYLTVLIEVVGGAALILGYKAKSAAWVLALFTVLATLVYHTDFPSQMTAFLKNGAIIGGLLYVYVHGAGTWTLGK